MKWDVVGEGDEVKSYFEEDAVKGATMGDEIKEPYLMAVRAKLIAEGRKTRMRLEFAG